MIPSIFKKHNNNHDRRSSLDCRPNFVQRSDVEKFLNEKGRFKRQKEIAYIASKLSNGEVADRRQTGINRRFGSERRSNRDRRCGADTQSEIEKFLEGERRSRLNRRSRLKDGYLSFKKARAFVRGLELKSLREWRDYAKLGRKPDDIPVAPHGVYANDGSAGWINWLNGGGLGVIKLLARCRQRKATATAWPRHLIGFWRDRREAVFLYALKRSAENF